MIRAGAKRQDNVSPDELWCRITVTGAGAPGVEVIDVLAGLTLMARRAGVRLDVAEAAPELVELLELSGLARQVLGHAEDREQPSGVEETMHAVNTAVGDLEDL